MLCFWPIWWLLFAISWEKAFGIGMDTNFGTDLLLREQSRAHTFEIPLFRYPLSLHANTRLLRILSSRSFFLHRYTCYCKRSSEKENPKTRAAVFFTRQKSFQRVSRPLSSTWHKMWGATAKPHQGPTATPLLVDFNSGVWGGNAGGYGEDQALGRAMGWTGRAGLIWKWDSRPGEKAVGVQAGFCGYVKE